MRSKFFAFVVLICLVAMAAFSQEITGDIRGIVRDPSGAVVSGATVQVLNNDRNEVVRAATTGADAAM